MHDLLVRRPDAECVAGRWRRFRAIRFEMRLDGAERVELEHEIVGHLDPEFLLQRQHQLDVGERIPFRDRLVAEVVGHPIALDVERTCDNVLDVVMVRLQWRLSSGRRSARCSAGHPHGGLRAHVRRASRAGPCGRSWRWH